jgi:hypothetical protein
VWQRIRGNRPICQQIEEFEKAVCRRMPLRDVFFYGPHGRLEFSVGDP